MAEPQKRIPVIQISMVLMVIVGLANVSSHALVKTVIQPYSPPEFHGRSMAIFHMSQVVTTLGSMLIGALSMIAIRSTRWAQHARIFHRLVPWFSKLKTDGCMDERIVRTSKSQPILRGCLSPYR